MNKKNYIPIQTHNENQSVNARDLHRFLEVGRYFSNWIKQRIEKYDFIEGRDYEISLAKSGKQVHGGHNIKEYVISMGMAKELSMLENSEKGKEARRYFIRAEEDLTNLKEQAKLTQESHPQNSTLFDNLISRVVEQERQKEIEYIDFLTMQDWLEIAGIKLNSTEVSIFKRKISNTMVALEYHREPVYRKGRLVRAREVYDHAWSHFTSAHSRHSKKSEVVQKLLGLEEDNNFSIETKDFNELIQILAPQGSSHITEYTFRDIAEVLVRKGLLKWLIETKKGEAFTLTASSNARVGCVLKRYFTTKGHAICPYQNSSQVYHLKAQGKGRHKKFYVES